MFFWKSERAALKGIIETQDRIIETQDRIAASLRETILGHVVGGKVERSYARSDLLDRRRPVMEAWAAHVTGAASGVVRIRG